MKEGINSKSTIWSNHNLFFCQLRVMFVPCDGTANPVLHSVLANLLLRVAVFQKSFLGRRQM